MKKFMTSIVLLSSLAAANIVQASWPEITPERLQEMVCMSEAIFVGELVDQKVDYLVELSEWDGRVIHNYSNLGFVVVDKVLKQNESDPLSDLEHLLLDGRSDSPLAHMRLPKKTGAYGVWLVNLGSITTKPREPYLSPEVPFEISMLEQIRSMIGQCQ